MTETEAKTKWCPYRAQHQATAIALISAGRENFDVGDCTCFGSHCMMWKWDQGHCEIKPAAEPGMVKLEFDHSGNGYCGLAGRA